MALTDRRGAVGASLVLTQPTLLDFGDPRRGYRNRSETAAQQLYSEGFGMDPEQRELMGTVPQLDILNRERADLMNEARQGLQDYGRMSYFLSSDTGKDWQERFVKHKENYMWGQLALKEVGVDQELAAQYGITDKYSVDPLTGEAYVDEEGNPLTIKEHFTDIYTKRGVDKRGNFVIPERPFIYNPTDFERWWTTELSNIQNITRGREKIFLNGKEYDAKDLPANAYGILAQETLSEDSNLEGRRSMAATLLNLNPEDFRVNKSGDIKLKDGTGFDYRDSRMGTETSAWLASLRSDFISRQRRLGKEWKGNEDEFNKFVADYVIDEINARAKKGAVRTNWQISGIGKKDDSEEKGEPQSITPGQKLTNKKILYDRIIRGDYHRTINGSPYIIGQGEEATENLIGRSEKEGPVPTFFYMDENLSNYSPSDFPFLKNTIEYRGTPADNVASQAVNARTLGPFVYDPKTGNQLPTSNTNAVVLSHNAVLYGTKFNFTKAGPMPVLYENPATNELEPEMDVWKESSIFITEDDPALKNATFFSTKKGTRPRGNLRKAQQAFWTLDTTLRSTNDDKRVEEKINKRPYLKEALEQTTEEMKVIAENEPGLGLRFDRGTIDELRFNMKIIKNRRLEKGYKDEVFGPPKEAYNVKEAYNFQEWLKHESPEEQGYYLVEDPDPVIIRALGGVDKKIYRKDVLSPMWTNDWSIIGEPSKSGSQAYESANENMADYYKDQITNAIRDSVDYGALKNKYKPVK
jgi:hypothetical protein